MEDWAAIVGPEHARAGDADDAVGGVVPAAVVRPGSVDELRAVVARRAALVASGAGGHLDVGAPPRRLDVVVRLDRLARIVDHQAADMTVTVEAGCPLPALQATLATAGQWLPLDPPRADRTTVGGLIAANLSGPLRASQGTVRDLLLGLRVVGAGGVVVAGGGRVVKNVAGYDLPKLHVGALGTLGIVVEATFKVRPRPAGEGAVVVACRSARQAGEVAIALRDAVEPLWLEAAGTGGLAEGPGDGAAVAIGFGGIAAEVADATARAQRTAEALGCRVVDVADGAALRTRLAGFDGEPAAAVLRLAGLPADVAAVMEEAETAARAVGAAVRCLAHGANGVVRVAVARGEDVAPLVARLRPGAERRGGSCAVHRAAPGVAPGLDRWGDPGDGLALMRRVKAAFDPDDVFAPGRFVGGL